MNELHEFFLELKASLLNYGWTNYSHRGNAEGPGCILNHMGSICHEDREKIVVSGRAEEMMVSHIADIESYAHIHKWNDAQTSVEPIINIIDECILELVPSDAVQVDEQRENRTLVSA